MPRLLIRPIKKSRCSDLCWRTGCRWCLVDDDSSVRGLQSFPQPNTNTDTKQQGVFSLWTRSVSQQCCRSWYRKNFPSFPSAVLTDRQRMHWLLSVCLCQKQADHYCLTSIPLEDSSSSESLNKESQSHRVGHPKCLILVPMAFIQLFLKSVSLFLYNCCCWKQGIRSVTAELHSGQGEQQLSWDQLVPFNWH